MKSSKRNSRDAERLANALRFSLIALASIKTGQENPPFTHAVMNNAARVLTDHDSGKRARR